MAIMANAHTSGDSVSLIPRSMLRALRQNPELPGSSPSTPSKAPKTPLLSKEATGLFVGAKGQRLSAWRWFALGASRAFKEMAGGCSLLSVAGGYPDHCAKLAVCWLHCI